MKRFLSLLLTFMLILSVFSTLGVVVHATEPEQDGGSTTAEQIVLPEFIFPTTTETELSVYNLPLDEIKALFPEEAETKYEDGIYYIKDIGAASAAVLNYFNYEYYDLTLVDGYWTAELTEEEAAAGLDVQFYGDYWMTSYMNGKRVGWLQLNTEGNYNFINADYGDDLCEVHYSIGQDISVTNGYVNGVLTSHSVSKNIDNGFVDIYYNPDKSVNCVALYVRSVGDYRFLLDEGWSEISSSYVPTDAPEGYEDYTLDDFAELLPHDFDGNHPRPALITDVAIIVDGVEYWGNLAPIYADSTVVLKVYGTNLQNGTDDNRIDYAKNALITMDFSIYTWTVDESGTFASSEIAARDFYNVFEDWTVEYRNQSGDSFSNSTTSVRYIPTIEETPLTEGENNITFESDKFKYYSFVPEENGTYIISSSEATWSVMEVYDSGWSVIKKTEEFNAELYLFMGNTYYFVLEVAGRPFDVTFNIEKHEHSGGEQTCLGYLCECGEYYGEESENHNLGDNQTCIGYQCGDCLGYFGEGNGVHTDGADEHINMCDSCKKYTPTTQVSVALGENTVSLVGGKYILVPFVPSESAAYRFYSISEGKDPSILIFDADMNQIASNDDANGYDFDLSFALDEGKTYYLAFYSYSANHDCTVMIEIMHLHEEFGEQTCEGYYCSICNDYFGEPIEHETSVAQTCRGYLCKWCGEYYGETSDDHHRDIDDSDVNRCDYCGEYCADEDLILGDNVIFVDLFADEDGYTINSLVFMRFVPTASGEYLIYSTTDKSDPVLTIYDSEWDQLYYADDNNGYNFKLRVELEANQTYYFELSDFQAPAEYTVTLEFHEHDYVLTCLGYLCDGCGDLYGEPGEEHRLQETQTCHGYVCIDCRELFGEADPDAHLWYYGWCYFCVDVKYPDDLPCNHVWDEGDCKICGNNHDCKPEDFDEDGYCVVCDEDAGCTVTTNGVTKYYRTFTLALEAAVDGSVITFLESRVFTRAYNIDKDIIIDLNGYSFRAEDENAMINVYANVTFMDSKNDGFFYTLINIYEKCVLLNGEYYLVEMYNGLTYSDVMFNCSEFYLYSDAEDGYVQVTLSELEGLDYFYGLYIDNTDSTHIANDYVVVQNATCTENAVEGSYCIYCDKLLDTRVVEDSAIGHKFSGNYGEGTKSCDGCGLTVKSKVYGTDTIREASADATRTAVKQSYETVTDILMYIYDEYLKDYIGFIVEDFAAYINQ